MLLITQDNQKRHFLSFTWVIMEDGFATLVGITALPIEI